jgi:hypothetical protein
VHGQHCRVRPSPAPWLRRGERASLTSSVGALPRRVVHGKRRMHLRLDVVRDDSEPAPEQSLASCAWCSARSPAPACRDSRHPTSTRRVDRLVVTTRCLQCRRLTRRAGGRCEHCSKTTVRGYGHQHSATRTARDLRAALVLYLRCHHRPRRRPHHTPRGRRPSTRTASRPLPAL